jgi:hypothetical protein
MSRGGIPTEDCTDHDFVLPTVYRYSKLKVLPAQYDTLHRNPMFTPLKMDPIIDSGPNLPIGTDSSDPETLFRLFFDDSVLDRLVNCTNTNAAVKIATTPLKTPWKPVNREDILSYLGVLIWSGLYLSPRRESYWNTRPESPVHEAIGASISRNRWKAIHQYFHIWERSDPPDMSQQKVFPHEKVEPLAQILRQNF